MIPEQRILMSGLITLTNPIHQKIVFIKAKPEYHTSPMSSSSELPTLCIDALLGYIELKELRNPDSTIQQMWPAESTLELQRRERTARHVITEFLTRAYNDGTWLCDLSGKMDSCKATVDTVFDYKALAMEIWEQICATGTNQWAKVKFLTYALDEDPNTMTAPSVYNRNGRNYNFIFILWSYIYH
jgi:hypothetical protein